MAVSWQKEEAKASMIADRSLYLDKSESVVVEEGDPRSAFLLISKGREIPADYVARLDLIEVDGRVYQRGQEPKPEASKQQRKSARSESRVDE